MADRPTLADVLAARRRLAGLVRHTPLLPAPALSARIGVELRVKLETTQLSRGFKARGAANAILSDSGRARAHGVVAYSTGNFGRVVARVAAP